MGERSELVPYQRLSFTAVILTEAARPTGSKAEWKLSRIAGVRRGPQHARFSRAGVGIRRRNPERSRGSSEESREFVVHHIASGSSPHTLVPSQVPAGDDW